MSQNTLSVLQTVLKLSNISYTSFYLKHLIKEEPDRDNLYGIIKILQLYGLVFDVYRIESLDGSTLLNYMPFITYYKEDIIVVHKMDNLELSIYKDGKIEKLEQNQFCSNWSGIVAKFVIGESSGEPFYNKHKKSLSKRYFNYIVLCIISVGMLAYFLVLEEIALWRRLILILSILGAYISFNLIRNQYVDIRILHKICNIFSNSNCNYSSNGLIKPHISIIGFSFFLAIGLFSITSYISIEDLSILILLSSVEVIWSIISQLKSKRYCVLCLMVQLILVVMIALSFNSEITNVSLLQMIPLIILFSFFMGFVYILLMHLFTDYNNAIGKNNQMNSKIKSLIEDYISILLKDPNIATTNKSKRNEQASILLFLNPFCNPCKYEFLSAYNILRNGINGKKVIPIILTKDKQKTDLVKWLLSGNVMDRMGKLYEWYSHRSTNNFRPLENNGMSDSNVKKIIDMNMKLANKYRVTSTPAIVYGGVKISNCISIKDLILTQ